jgi:hypothetical protein
MKHFYGHKEALASFRLVCHAWREAYDCLVTIIRPRGTAPDALVWRKFRGAKALSFGERHYGALVSDDDVKALSPLTTLTYLNLNNCEAVSDEALRALAPHTALTTLKLADCERVSNKGLRALAPLTGLTSLNLAF